MHPVVMIICAVQELSGSDWEQFKANWAGDANEVYQAYAALRDSSSSHTAYYESILWDWYCELTGR